MDTFSVRDGVDFAGQSSSGTPESLIFAPLFRSLPAGGTSYGAIEHEISIVGIVTSTISNPIAGPSVLVG